MLDMDNEIYVTQPNPETGGKLNGLKKWGHAIEKKFNANLRMNLRRDGFKNKFTTWSKNYKTVKQMKNQSGFGWNEESHMVIIDESLWDDNVMFNPLTNNFKGKTFEYWKELSIIVSNDFVEGTGARTRGTSIMMLRKLQRWL
ncbi:hypothetical protein AMTRI_Chr02g218310 [Amborella trichopoda]